MSSLLLALALLAADLPAVTVKLAPSTSLALDVALAVAARVQKLAVTTDPEVSDADKADAVAALARTGLFAITEPALATATLSLTRVDPEIILATVTAADGSRLWIGRVAWPSAAPTPEKIETARPESDATYKGILRYKRDRIRVLPVVRSFSASPFGYGWFAPDRPFDPFPWGVGYAPTEPMSNAPNDWVLMRGAADVIDELKLAQLLEDTRLTKRIEEARFWPELFWATGFGVGAVAGVGSGAYLSGAKNRDTRAVGVSLITLGAVSAVLALLFPSAGPTHVLSEVEAQEGVDTYNEALRAKLGLSGDDVERHLPGE